jgi:hypothetical protein
MKWSDEDIELALRDLRCDDPPPGTLAAVRAQVLEQTQRRRAAWWTWGLAPGLAAVAVLAVVLWPRHSDAVLPEPQPPPAPALAEVLVPAPEPQRPAAPVRRKTVKLKTPEEQTEFIRLFTDDPDVVIYWSLETKGGAE